MAASLLDSLQLGRRDETDFLAIAFSALDMMGHDFGPRSREVEDMLIRLDATLGALIQRLDETVGRDRYVLALTGDHGVAAIPEQMQAGRLVTEDIQQVAENVLVARWGAPASGRYVENVAVGHIYFAPGVFDRLRARAGDAARRSSRRSSRMPGVARVLRGDRAVRHVRGSGGSRRRLRLLPRPQRRPDRRAEAVLDPRAARRPRGHRTRHDVFIRPPRAHLSARKWHPPRTLSRRACLLPMSLRRSPTSPAFRCPQAEGRVLTEALK